MEGKRSWVRLDALRRVDPVLQPALIAAPSLLAQGLASSDPATRNGVTPSLRTGLAAMPPHAPERRSIAGPAPRDTERGMLLADPGGSRRAMLRRGSWTLCSRASVPCLRS